MLGKLFLLLALLYLQDSYTIKTLQMELKKDHGKYYFVLEGRCNFPDGVRLTAELYYLSKSEEGGLEENFLSSEAIFVRNKRFSVWFGGYHRKPFSITYRGVIMFDPEDQTPPFQKMLKGAKKMISKVDLRLGDEQSFKKEIKEVKDSLYADLKETYEIFEAIKCALFTYKNLSEQRWQGLKKELDFEGRIRKLEAENEKRIGEWIVEEETEGIICIERLTAILQKILKEGEGLIKTRSSFATTQLQALFEDFRKAHQESMIRLGFEQRVELAKIKPLFDRIRSGLLRLEDYLRQGRAKQKELEEIESIFMETVLELSVKLPPTRIKSLCEISASLQKLCSACKDDLSAKVLMERLEEVKKAVYMFELKIKALKK